MIGLLRFPIPLGLLQILQNLAIKDKDILRILVDVFVSGICQIISLLSHEFISLMPFPVLLILVIFLSLLLCSIPTMCSLLYCIFNHHSLVCHSYWIV